MSGAMKSSAKQNTREATVIFQRNNKVTFVYDDEFSVSAFDAWVRSRFGVDAGVGLRYVCNSLGVLASYARHLWGRLSFPSSVEEDWLV